MARFVLMLLQYNFPYISHVRGDIDACLEELSAQVSDPWGGAGARAETDELGQCPRSLPTVVLGRRSCLWVKLRNGGGGMFFFGSLTTQSLVCRMMTLLANGDVAPSYNTYQGIEEFGPKCCLQRNTLFFGYGVKKTSSTPLQYMASSPRVGPGVAYSFVAYLSHLTIDHASLSSRTVGG